MTEKEYSDLLQIIGKQYIMVIKGNITEDSFEIIKSRIVVQADKMSEAFEYFIKKGMIFEKDLGLYKDFVSTARLGNLLKESKGDIRLKFRALIGREYKWIKLEIDKALDYTDDNQTVVILITDINEEVEKENQLSEALMKLKVEDASKSNMLSRMSYDIRTALNGIVGMADIAVGIKDVNSIVVDCNNKIRESAKQILGIVEEAVELNSLIKSGMDYNAKAIDIIELWNNVCNSFYSRMQEKNITFTVNKGKCIHNELFADNEKLKKVFTNLLENSLRYTSYGGTVTASIKEIDSYDDIVVFEFVFQDNGAGISKEVLPRIFEVRNARSSESVPGENSRLHMVKQLLSNMGGTISVESERSEGSRFSVTIPFRIQSIKSDEIVYVTNEAVKDNNMQLNILIAEDNELNMEVEVFMVESVNANAIKAINGKECVEKFAKSQPGEIDLIIMDIVMPEMNGHEAATAIRAMDRADAKSVPIIAMSANAFRGDKTKSLEAGMNEHIAKPFDIDTVRRIISTYTGRNN